MRGHQPLIDMRRAGKAPRSVFVDAFEDHSQAWRDWPTVNPAAPQIEILPTEMLSGLDLRFVVGLIVILTGHDAARVAKVREACFEAGATRVVSAVLLGDGAAMVTDSESPKALPE